MVAAGPFLRAYIRRFAPKATVHYATSMSQPFTLPSFAKINLYLRVIGKREDGFHELCTVFQTISMHDRISFELADDLKLTCTDPSVPTDESNLILKAANELKSTFGVDAGARIHLEKNIPSPGGLGGGSSNAVVALFGLARLWELEVPDERLREISASLGSDVPFFIGGGTALGTGRGELIEPLPDIEGRFLMVVTPPVSVSTATAFAAIGAPSLTNTDSKRILRVCRNEADAIDLHHSVLKNDFERSVFDTYPEIRSVKETLLELGAVNAMLSGSGASVFAVFDKEETRQAAMKALDHRSTWRKFAVAAISRSEYREAFRR